MESPSPSTQRLIVALGTKLDLLLEALLLVDGVVELGESIAHLTAADKQLKALGEPVVLGAALCKRGNINRMHSDEGRLDELFLDELVKALVQGVTPSGLDLIHVDTGGLCGCNGFGIALYSYRLTFDFPTDAGLLNYLRGRSFQVESVPFREKYFG